MGMTLDDLETKLGLTPYYAPLFNAAFGSPVVTRQRIALALSQFVRSLESFNAKFDRALVGGVPNSTAVFTPQELLGFQLFAGGPGGPAGPGGPGRGGPGAPPPPRALHCDGCHRTSAVASDAPHNNGLDLSNTADTGAGNGRFKAPSLRNVAVRGRWMHDGRFTSLQQVVEFYDSGVQANPNLDPRLQAPDGKPRRLNLSQVEKDALVAYLNTLTDAQFLASPKFASPFPKG
jgi:cytochrome c peroxidase